MAAAFSSFLSSELKIQQFRQKSFHHQSILNSGYPCRRIFPIHLDVGSCCQFIGQDSSKPDPIVPPSSRSRIGRNSTVTIHNTHRRLFVIPALHRKILSLSRSSVTQISYKFFNTNETQKSLQSLSYFC